MVGYAILFSATFIAISLVRSRFRKQRPPLEFEYNRLPGESLSNRIEKATERLLGRFFACLIAPPVAAFISFPGLSLFHPDGSETVRIATCASVLFISLFVTAWYLGNEFRRIYKLELGLKGERIVADFLKPLEREGWQVFHDVPARSNGKDFNLDHVAVGPSGVTLVETKTYSKGKSIEGRKVHVVKYDGAKLEWPWGNSKSDLRQLKRQKDWLESWIYERIGRKVAVSSILALPGWSTEESKARANVRVLSHKNLCDAIKGKGDPSLDSNTIDLVARQLASLCRVSA